MHELLRNLATMRTSRQAANTIVLMVTALCVSACEVGAETYIYNSTHEGITLSLRGRTGVAGSDARSCRLSNTSYLGFAGDPRSRPSNSDLLHWSPVSFDAGRCEATLSIPPLSTLIVDQTYKGLTLCDLPAETIERDVLQFLSVDVDGARGSIQATGQLVPLVFKLETSTSCVLRYPHGDSQSR